MIRSIDVFKRCTVLMCLLQIWTASGGEAFEFSRGDRDLCIYLYPMAARLILVNKKYNGVCYLQWDVSPGAIHCCHHIGHQQPVKQVLCIQLHDVNSSIIMLILYQELCIYSWMYMPTVYQLQFCQLWLQTRLWSMHLFSGQEFWVFLMYLVCW